MNRPACIACRFVRRYQLSPSHVNKPKTDNFQRNSELTIHRHRLQERHCHSSLVNTETPKERENPKTVNTESPKAKENPKTLNTESPKAKEIPKTEFFDEKVSTQFVPSQSRRVIVDPASVKQVFYFDTLSYVKRLEKNGCSREQAEGITECFTDIIHSTIDYQSRNMTTKPQQEILTQQLLAEISSIKKDMVILQKSEFTSLQHETDKLGVEIKMLKETLDDEMGKVKGQIKLDINLERGRAIEAHAGSEKELAQLHNKIDTGIANLKTMFEQYRNDMFKYAGGTVLTMASLSLALMRFLH
ncbi:hypothetical protein LOTGIDRAFT_163625 [Lottia gigantea]|uniref:Mitochondrial calcium uniporter regulator 1 n=1 Tax=Lottia gigantea TaxID=225164 RepID=V4A316_LOTGI|nr:hypothetical protein LOTGIDRAFT_163625 [Lottia gigantea]ESO91097.1 hypothetical protein LOTGIDRAFT_163625 [Lottia gigantea]